MADSARPVGEEEFQAWVDGRLTPERSAAVDAYLAAHPEQRTRLSQYAEQRRALHSAFTEQETPIPARLDVARLAASARRRTRRRTAQIAAATLLFLSGGAAGWTVGELGGPLGWSGPAATGTIIADAVAAHRVFEIELDHPVDVPAAQQANLGEWLSNRLGRRLIIPDLTALGLKLLGGRLLPSEAGAAAQLMYQDGRGTRLTIYLRAGITGDTTLYREDRDIGVFYWADEGLACAIVARPADREALLQVAESAYAQLMPNAPKGEFSHVAGSGG
jgi:anti-sigma factor RsiW